MIERMIVTIEPLNREREILVLLPNNYDETDKEYPVLYINDGQNAFFDEEAFGGKSWGFQEYHNNEVIMVGICCNFEGYKRMDEYGPWPISKELSEFHTRKENFIIGGEGKNYIDWLKDELKPWIDQKYRTIKDDTAITGSSMGGVISAYATLKYPEAFNKCAALSTAFWFYGEEFTKLIETSDLSKVKCFYFDLGSLEGGDGNDTVSEWYIDSNNYIYSLLKPRINNLHYHIFENAYHNEWEWAKRVPFFMDILYSDNKK